MGDRVRKYVHANNGYVFFMEQTVYNAVMQGKMKIFHPKYNTYSMMQTLSYGDFMKLRKVERYYSKKEIQEALESPILVHMTSSFWIVNRPWNKVTNHPMKDEYKEYVELTPWSDLVEEDRRDLKKKTVDWFVQQLPKEVVISIAGILYNGRRVNRIKKELNLYQNGTFN